MEPVSWRLLTAALVLTALSALASELSGQGSARIVLGPESRISIRPGTPHVELSIAAAPHDPLHLVAAAISFSGRGGQPRSVPFISRDGGGTWYETPAPGQMLDGGVDPQVAIGDDGTAYFVALGARSLQVHRARDGGVDWRLVREYEGVFDHPVLTAHPRSPDTLYLAFLYGLPEYAVGIARSTDGGRSWSNPAKVVAGRGSGVNPMPMQVLSDGTVFLPFFRFELDSEARKDGVDGTFEFVLSRDGGQTFESPIVITKVTSRGSEAATAAHDRGEYWHPQWPVFARAPAGPHADRLYAAWNTDSSRLAVRLSWSDDHGQSWTVPQVVAPGLAATGAQFLATMGVNADGVLGLSWLQVRGRNSDDLATAYFTASLDGGETFLPPTRISEADFHPAGPGNRHQVLFFAGLARDRFLVSTGSAYSRWPDGGDYAEMAIDADGAFHPTWPDSRSGTAQAYTRRITVTTDPGVRLVAGDSQDVTQLIEVFSDPVSPGPDPRITRLPIRIRNTSGDTLFGPLTLEILDVRVSPGSLSDEAPSGVDLLTFLNADNGVTDLGAVFDLTSSLGDPAALPPGRASGPVILEYHLDPPARSAVFDVKVRARK